MTDETAFQQLVIDTLNVLTQGYKEIKQELIAVGMTAQQTLQQATKTNGRVDQLERRADALEGRNHDSDLVEQARREQVAEVKAKAFGLVRALDNKLVTSLVLLALFVAGWSVRAVLPW